MGRIKLGSFNARGLRDFKKRISVFEHFKQRRCNIIAKQEAHSKSEDEIMWSANWLTEGEIKYNHNSGMGSGQICLFRNKFNILECENLISGRIQKIKLQIDNCLYIMCMHLIKIKSNKYFLTSCMIL